MTYLIYDIIIWYIKKRLYKNNKKCLMEYVINKKNYEIQYFIYDRRSNVSLTEFNMIGIC